MTAEDRIVVADRAAAGATRRAARARAAALGFDETATEEIALAAAELATNLVKHAGAGEIRLYDLDADAPGIGIESTDLGPGIGDVDAAIADGVSTAASLGYGLGTVHRLMDDLEVTAAPDRERGTRIVCTRRLRRPGSPAGVTPLDIAAAGRPAPGSEISGDTFLVKRWAHHALVAVFDGLGHGRLAARASYAARSYMERHHDHPLDRLLRGAHRACRGTRGVVLAAARIDLDSGSLAYASVGNIQGRLWDGPSRRGLVAQRGVVGLNVPTPSVQTHPWTDTAMLIIHSDGLSSRWGAEDVSFHGPQPSAPPASVCAREILGRFATGRDDAIAVVVKGGST